MGMGKPNLRATAGKAARRRAARGRGHKMVKPKPTGLAAWMQWSKDNSPLVYAAGGLAVVAGLAAAAVLSSWRA